MPDTTFRARVTVRSRHTGAILGHRWSLAVASPTAAAAAPTFARWVRLWEAVAPPGLEYQIEGIYPSRPDRADRVTTPSAA